MALILAKLLQRTFNIYPNEQRFALRFAFLGFIWAFAATSALKFADALFILHVGAESLPIAYTINACGMFVIASILLYAFHHYSSYKIYSSLLSFGVVFYLGVLLLYHFGISADAKWFWYALKWSGFSLYVVLLTNYWTFIDQYHHLQDAKRLYTLYSATIFLGFAATGLIMNAGILDLSHLLALIVILFAFSLFLIKRIVNHAALISHEESEPSSQYEETGSPILTLLKAILSSRFTLLLMANNLITYLLLITTEYNYLYTFGAYFGAESDAATGGGTEAQLTLFLGKCLSFVSVFNLIFGLFIYSRLIRRFGISGLLMITPVLLIIAFTGWSVTPLLLFPLIGFFVCEGTLNVIDDSNFNLLLNAVPTKLKHKIRVMIESFFEPVGMLISAMLLTMFQAESKLLGLILSFCSLGVALAVRANYLKALFSNLSESAIHFYRRFKDWIAKMPPKRRSDTIVSLFSNLADEQNTTDARLIACEGLLAYEDIEILKKILFLSDNFSPKLKSRFLDLLENSPFAQEGVVWDRLREWTQREYDPALNQRIHFYLAKQGLIHPEKAVEDLQKTDIQLIGAAIIALKNSWATLPPGDASHYRNLAAQHLKMLLDSTVEEELSMGLQILGVEGKPHDVDILIPYLSHPSKEIARTAARSIAMANEIDSIRQAPQIIRILSESKDSSIRLNCLQALGKVDDSGLVRDIIQASLHFRPHERRLAEEIISKMGLRTVPTLLAITKDTLLPDRCRLLAGRILARLSLPLLRANLSGIIRNEIDRAYFYFYYHHTIQKEHPDVDLSILTSVLITNYQSVINFIIQLLSSAEEVEDAELLSQSLQSPNPKVRSQVIETLEKTCEPAIFRLLSPLVDEIPQSEKLRTYLKTHPSPLSLTELLDKMSESSAQIDRLTAATLKYHLKLPNWRASLRQQITTQDEIFHHFAYELLDS